MKYVFPLSATAAAAVIVVSTFARQVSADGDSPKAWSCPNIDGELRIAERIVVCAAQQSQLCLGVLGPSANKLNKKSAIGLTVHDINTEKDKSEDSIAWTFRCSEEEGNLYLQHPLFEELCLGTKDNQFGRLLACDGDHDGGNLVHVVPQKGKIDDWQLVIDKNKSNRKSCLAVGQEIGSLASYSSAKDSKLELLSHILECNTDGIEALSLGQQWVSRDINDKSDVHTPANIYVQMQAKKKHFESAVDATKGTGMSEAAKVAAKTTVVANDKSAADSKGEDAIPAAPDSDTSHSYNLTIVAFLLALLIAVVIIRRRHKTSDESNAGLNNLPKGGPYQVVSAADEFEYFDEEEFGDDHYEI